MRILTNPFMYTPKQIILPVPFTVPTDLSNLTLIDSIANSATHKIVALPRQGWYLAYVSAASGGVGESGQAGALGGTIHNAVFYAYADSIALMWGANTATRWVSATGYPVPSNALGGTGGRTVDESGGPGGGAGNHGQSIHTDAGFGGSGAGIIVGFSPQKVKSQMQLESWNVGSFNVAVVEAMILASGGGGSVGKNGNHRRGGASGGAWGNGGGAYPYNNSYISGESGPGGDAFGRGNNGPNLAYGGAVPGVWALRDFTKNEFIWGSGQKPGATFKNGTVELYWINNQ